MPIATTLPAQSVTLRFPRDIDTEESYQLLELPAEVLKQVEGKSEPLRWVARAIIPTFRPNPWLIPRSLTIKGRPSDDAVLCTPTGTYTLRSVSVSNSLLVCRAPVREGKGLELEIRDTSHEIIELVPQPPDVERIRSVLRASAWRGLGHPLPGAAGKKRKRADGVEEQNVGRRYTLEQLRSVVQASEAELGKALKERNVVEIDGESLVPTWA